ncbi:unnamed protein product [Miscanthus lutarioriparius]|uniref:Cytochrome P450 n=1 Tax=Miscanthus lutarioriparius TaxID=422564 RepID=A0A811Q718_9POAL|nr:unnamed protein product [Miscanthus lutarioriparius]
MAAISSAASPEPAAPPADRSPPPAASTGAPHLPRARGAAGGAPHAPHCVVASTADVARELIRDHDATISGRPVSVLSRLFSYGSAGFAFTPNSRHWRFLKRLCVSEVLGPRTVEQLRHVRRGSLAALLRAVRASSARGEAVDVTRELILLSNTAIIRMVASDVRVTDEAQELVKAVTELLVAFNLEDYVPLCRGWDLQGLRRKATRVHRRFDAVLEQMIRHKEEARDRERARGGGGMQEEKKVEGPPATCKQRNKDLLDKSFKVRCTKVL